MIREAEKLLIQQEIDVVEETMAVLLDELLYWENDLAEVQSQKEADEAQHLINELTTAREVVMARGRFLASLIS